MQINKFLEKLKDYGLACHHIRSILLVGSYARGDFRADSDI